MFPTTFSFPSCVAINELVRLEMLGFFVVVAVIVFSLQRSSPTVSAVRSYTSHVRLSGIRKGKKNKMFFCLFFSTGHRQEQRQLTRVTLPSSLPKAVLISSLHFFPVATATAFFSFFIFSPSLVTHQAAVPKSVSAAAATRHECAK